MSDTTSQASGSPGVAVVGAGYWGKNLIRNFADLGALRWICDTNEAAADEAAASHAPTRSTANIDDVLADDDVRGIVIATPAALHTAVAKQAAAARKDIFVEKPLAMTYADGREAVEAAEAAGVLMMVGHIFVHHPAVKSLRDLVTSGELGTIRYVYSSRLNLGRVRQEENILFSFAPHDISIIEYVLGAEPTAVSSTGGSYVQEGIADVTVTNLEFAGDVRGHIFVSWLHPYREKKLVVIGDKKMAVFDDMAPASGPGSKLTLYDKGIDWTPDGRPIPRHSGDTPVPIDPAEPMRIECRAFLTSIRDRTQPLTDGRSGLAVQKVLEAARRSLELGGTRVLLSEIEETPVDA